MVRFILFNSFPAYVDILTAENNEEYAELPWWQQCKTATQGNKDVLKTNRKLLKKLESVKAAFA